MTVGPRGVAILFLLPVAVTLVPVVFAVVTQILIGLHALALPKANVGLLYGQTRPERNPVRSDRGRLHQ